MDRRGAAPEGRREAAAVLGRPARRGSAALAEVHPELTRPEPLVAGALAGPR